MLNNLSTMDLRGDGEGREVIVIFLTMGKASNQRQSWAGLAKKQNKKKAVGSLLVPPPFTRPSIL